MTDIATLRQQAAQARAGAAGSTSMAVPRDRPESPEIRFTSQLRAKKVTRDDMDWYEVEGYASAFEQGYEMWDMFGPYTEIVSKGAADKTLGADPEVVFRFNHAGTPMASTRNSRLQLWADEHGLGQRAWLNPKRSDVQLLVQAIEDEDVREQSFMSGSPRASGPRTTPSTASRSSTWSAATSARSPTARTRTRPSRRGAASSSTSSPTCPRSWPARHTPAWHSART